MALLTRTGWMMTAPFLWLEEGGSCSWCFAHCLARSLGLGGLLLCFRGGPKPDSLAGARLVSLVALLALMARAARGLIQGLGRLNQTWWGGMPCPNGSWEGWPFAGCARDLAGTAPIGSSQMGRPMGDAAAESAGCASKTLVEGEGRCWWGIDLSACRFRN